jgi:hypothetical protein
VPVVGGILWAGVGYQVTFLVDAATCLLSVAASWSIPRTLGGPPHGSIEEMERRGELSVTALGHAEGAVAIAPEEH